VGLFGSTVAIAGLANGSKLGIGLLGVPAGISTVVTVTGWILFILLTAAYLLKCFYYHDSVTAELKHPVTIHFLGTFFISAVLLAGLLLPYSLTAARWTWLMGTLGGLSFMCVQTFRLFKGNLDVSDAVPPTLIPGLTVLNAATSGMAMQLGPYGEQVNTFLFSIGIIYTFAFFVVIVYRVIHYEPLSNFLKPSLLLLCAPFEVGFLCYVSLVRRVDLFASVIFYFGLFIFIVLFFRVFNKQLRFAVSWWGACFSTAALTNAALLYAAVSHDPIVKWIGAGLLILLAGLVIITFWLTVQRLVTGQLLKP
jgi:tellurite resistance protein